MANNKNSFFDSITDKRTVPYNQALTGTYAIAAGSKNVVGTVTRFITELKKGDWLIDLTNDEIRRVTSIQSNTLATIDSAFTNAIAAETDFTPASRLVEISVVIPSGVAPGEIDGKALPAGTPVSWGKGSREGSAVRDLVDPIIVDAVGSSMLVQTLE